MQIGETLKQLRKDRGETQIAVQNKVGITQTYLSQIESGKKEPSPDVFRKLCKYYKVPTQIVAWQSLEEKDIQGKKKPIYKKLKPIIDKLISELLK